MPNGKNGKIYCLVIKLNICMTSLILNQQCIDKLMTYNIYVHLLKRNYVVTLSIRLLQNFRFIVWSSLLYNTLICIMYLACLNIICNIICIVQINYAIDAT